MPQSKNGKFRIIRDKRQPPINGLLGKVCIVKLKKTTSGDAIIDFKLDGAKTYRETIRPDSPFSIAEVVSMKADRSTFQPFLGTGDKRCQWMVLPDRKYPQRPARQCRAAALHGTGYCGQHARQWSSFKQEGAFKK